MNKVFVCMSHKEALELKHQELGLKLMVHFSNKITVGTHNLKRSVLLKYMFLPLLLDLIPHRKLIKGLPNICYLSKRTIACWVCSLFIISSLQNWTQSHTQTYKWSIYKPAVIFWMLLRPSFHKYAATAFHVRFPQIFRLCQPHKFLNIERHPLSS